MSTLALILIAWVALQGAVKVAYVLSFIWAAFVGVSSLIGFKKHAEALALFSFLVEWAIFTGCVYYLSGFGPLT